MLRKAASVSRAPCSTALRCLAALAQETSVRPEQTETLSGAKKRSIPRTYDPLPIPSKKWKPSRHVRKAPPEHVQGQVLYSLSHKDLKSLVNQAVDALKKATQWQAGSLTSGAMMHCLQSAAATRRKAFQLIQGQMLLVPKQNKLVTFAVEGFMGKIAAQTQDQEWTFLRNQEVMYDERNCIVHHLAGYKVSERGLQPSDIIASTPGPPKSPTSYQAFFKTDYVRVSPDWIMAVILKADKLSGPASKRIAKQIKFDVVEQTRRAIEQHGVPWYWIYNAWEGHLQVYKNSLPHSKAGTLTLHAEFHLESEEYSTAWRADPFGDSQYDLRTILGYRKDSRAYA